MRHPTAFEILATAALLATLGGCSAPPPAQPPVAETPAKSEDAVHHGHHGPMHHRFEDAEAWAEAFDDPERDAWQKPDDVIAMMKLAPDAVVADVGAGTGYFATRLARAVPQGRVVAADIEPDMVRYLTERAAKESLANLVAVQGAADDPKLTDPVDVVFMCNTAHHVADRSAYFERVASYLNNGGRVIIVDFRPDAPDDAPGPPKKHRITPETLAGELTAAGYEHLVTDAETLPYQYVSVFQLAAK